MGTNENGVMKELNEKELVNHFAMIAWTITVVIIMAAYLLEVIKGERSIGYYLVVVLFGAVPVVIAQILYHKVRKKISSDI